MNAKQKCSKCGEDVSDACHPRHAGYCAVCGKLLCYECSIWSRATNYERYCKECYSNLYTCKKCDLVKTKDEMGIYQDFCIHCIENYENEDKN